MQKQYVRASFSFGNRMSQGQVPTLSQFEIHYAGQCACIGIKYVHLDFQVSRPTYITCVYLQ